MRSCHALELSALVYIVSCCRNAIYKLLHRDVDLKRSINVYNRVQRSTETVECSRQKKKTNISKICHFLVYTCRLVAHVDKKGIYSRQCMANQTLCFDMRKRETNGVGSTR